jgi:stress response protein YsnF
VSGNTEREGPWFAGNGAAPAELFEERVARDRASERGPPGGSLFLKEVVLAQETLVALYPRIENADAARLDLEAFGIPDADISVRSRADMSAVGEATPQARQQPGFFEWLFGSNAPEEDLAGYRRHIADGNGAILSVRADSARYDGIAGILERHGPISLEEGDGRSVATEASAVQTPLSGEARSESAASEAVIPTAKEELEVGKRQVQDTRHYRVRRYIVEHPAEEQVALHDEKVTVEHRQPAQAAAPGERPFEEKTVEVTESREEPVVRKVVKPGEEVVVRKEGKDRVETVRDTVRESKVDIDKAAAGDKPQKS